MNYETQLMSKMNKRKFCKFLNDEIGTYYEVNESGRGDGQYYIFIVDLEKEEEIDKIVKFEKEM